MKGSAITGPVGKEAAELWPVSFLRFFEIANYMLTLYVPAYRLQLRCRDVKRFFLVYE